jgi:TetR/AcrR family transcriptional regulator
LTRSRPRATINQPVSYTSAATPRRPASRARRGPRRDTRAAILDAARAEFAANGFAGARVDVIARRARLNKAMLYYHFGDKRGLYREVLRDGFAGLVSEVRVATEAAPTPVERLDAYVGALLAAAEARASLVPIVLRELAGGGRNLDGETLRLMVGLFQVVRDVLDAGRRAGAFREVDPLLTHLMVIGSAITYVANKPIRDRIRRLRLPDGPAHVPTGNEPFARHLAMVLRQTLSTDKETSRHA